VIDMTFAQLSIGTTFARGTTFWRKRSSRTATILSGPGVGLWFYWGQSETIDKVLTPATNPQPTETYHGQH
jgi:hypothetical protein